MLSTATFTLTQEISEHNNVIRIIIDVIDDTATDQDVLSHIQTQSIYKNHALIQLDELARGTWVALFRKSSEPGITKKI